jgi:acyl carrier protein
MSEDVSVEQTVVRIVVGVLGESEDQLRAQPILASYEWDSLTTLEALAQIESELHITLDLRTYHAARTLSDLVSVVDEAVTARAAGAQR